MQNLNLKRILIFKILFFSSIIFATEKPSPGDIRIFNAPSTVWYLKTQLLACPKNLEECAIKDLVPISPISHELAPESYETFYFSDEEQASLEGKKVFLKLYSAKQKLWYPPIVLIKDYHKKEDPFYQFTCWDNVGPQLPHCTSGIGSEPGGD